MTDTNDTAPQRNLAVTIARALGWAALAIIAGFIAYHAGFWVGEAAAQTAIIPQPSLPQAPGLGAIIQPVF